VHPLSQSCPHFKLTDYQDRLGTNVRNIPPIKRHVVPTRVVRVLRTVLIPVSCWISWSMQPSRIARRSGASCYHQENPPTAFSFNVWLPSLARACLGKSSSCFVRKLCYAFVGVVFTCRACQSPASTSASSARTAAMMPPSSATQIDAHTYIQTDTDINVDTQSDITSGRPVPSSVTYLPPRRSPSRLGSAATRPCAGGLRVSKV
jgi:hypothetical protein